MAQPNPKPPQTHGCVKGTDGLPALCPQRLGPGVVPKLNTTVLRSTGQHLTPKILQQELGSHPTGCPRAPCPTHHRPGPTLPRHVPMPHSCGVSTAPSLPSSHLTAVLVSALFQLLLFSLCPPMMLWGGRSRRGTEIRLDTISFTHTFWLYSHNLSSSTSLTCMVYILQDHTALGTSQSLQHSWSLWDGLT